LNDLVDSRSSHPRVRVRVGGEMKGSELHLAFTADFSHEMG